MKCPHCGKKIVKKYKQYPFSELQDTERIIADNIIAGHQTIENIYYRCRERNAQLLKRLCGYAGIQIPKLTSKKSWQILRNEMIKYKDKSLIEVKT